MKKFIAALICAASVFSLSVFPAGASSAQSQILSLMNNNPVPTGENPIGLVISENPPELSMDAENIRDLYSVSKKIVSLSSGLTYSESAKIENKVNAYFDSIDEASSQVTDTNSEAYLEMLEQKRGFEAEILAQPPRISAVESIYPDEDFSVSVHCMYKSQKQREYTLILRNTATGKTIDSRSGVIPAGGTNGTIAFTAKHCSEGDTVSVTVRYNGAEYENIQGCVFNGIVLGNTKQLTSAAPTPVPSYKPLETPAVLGASDWAKEEIEHAIKLEIVPELLQKNYTQNISRAGFCNLAAALIEGCTQMNLDDFAAQHSNVQPEFTDTSDYTIKACARLGIVTGYDDGSFRPDDDITREQAAAMLARCARTLGMTDKPGMFAFNDRDAVSPWAINNVRFVKANEIMNGDENDNFMPQATYTTEQAIVTFYRLADKLGK
ncbi:MAG: S-layer homology domain-containing protein [Oscillospiraceae bacterium]|nr:S-layer homology domain-containing protein [Oscillospiraceae bacterium]